MVLTGFCKADGSVQNGTHLLEHKDDTSGESENKKGCGWEMVPGFSKAERAGQWHPPACLPTGNIPEGSCPSDQYFM